MSKAPDVPLEGAPEPSFTASLKGVYERHRIGLNFCVSMALALALWELVDYFFDDPDFFTGPVAVVIEYGSWSRSRASGSTSGTAAPS